MINNSFLVNKLILILNYFRHIYSKSFLAFCIKKFIDFIFFFWNGSFLRAIFYKDFNGQEVFEKSFINKSSNKVFVFIKSLTNRINNIAINSKVIICLNYIVNNFLYISIRSYAFFILGMNAALFTMQLFLKPETGQTNTVFYIKLGFCVIGLLCLMINTSLEKLYNASYLSKIAGDFFNLNIISKIVKNNYGLFALLGIILGLVGSFVDFKIMILAIAAIIGVLFIMSKTEIGIYITVFLIPLLPTKFILGLAFVTSFSFLIKLISNENVKLKATLMDLFVILFMLLLILSVFISYIPSNSAVMVITYLLFILFYFTVKSIIKTKQQLFSLVSLIAVSAFFVALIGIYQHYTGNFNGSEAWIDTAMFEGVQNRVFSTLDNPNVLGEYLLFAIPITFSMIYYFKNYFNKFIALIILGALCFCMYLTLSRGAWLGLIIAFGIFALIKDRRLIALGFIAILISPLFLPEALLIRFFSIGNMQDTSTAYRVSIWMASIKMIKDFWPIGIGLGTNVFIYIFQKYAFSASYALHSHNLYLQILIDLGIWGLVLFASYMLLFYKNILTKIKNSKSNFLTSFSAALCAGMSGYLIQGLTDNTWYNYRIVIFFWVALSLSAICKEIFINEAAVLDD